MAVNVVYNCDDITETKNASLYDIPIVFFFKMIQNV